MPPQMPALERLSLHRFHRKPVHPRDDADCSILHLTPHGPEDPPGSRPWSSPWLPVHIQSLSRRRRGLLMPQCATQVSQKATMAELWKTSACGRTSPAAWRPSTMMLAREHGMI